MNKWNIPDWLEKEVIARDVCCVYCGIKFGLCGTRKSKASWEHITNDARIVTKENIALCCVSCNASKGAKLLAEWIASAYCRNKNITPQSVADVVKRALLQPPKYANEIAYPLDQEGRSAGKPATHPLPQTLAMTLQTTLIYNESLIKKAVLSFWWRVVGIKYLIAIALVSYGLVYGLRIGDKSWLLGVSATILLLAITLIVTLYFIHYRNSIQKFKAMGKPQATFILTEDSFSFFSGAGSVTLPWSSVTDVWQFPECWLFLFSKSQFSTLPVANLSPEIQAFIVERISNAGGNVG